MKNVTPLGRQDTSLLFHYVRKCSADRLREAAPLRRRAALVCFLRQSYRDAVDQAADDLYRLGLIDLRIAGETLVVALLSDDLDGAIADYSKAIEVNPRYALAYSNRANVYQAIGDRASAASDRQKANELKR